MEEYNKELNTKLQDKTNELYTIQQSLYNEQLLSKTAQERANILEKQINIINDRLTTITGKIMHRIYVICT